MNRYDRTCFVFLISGLSEKIEPVWERVVHWNSEQLEDSYPLNGDDEVEAEDACLEHGMAFGVGGQSE